MSERIIGHINLMATEYPVIRVNKALKDRLLAEGVGHMTVRIDDAERCMVIRPVDVADAQEPTAG